MMIGVIIQLLYQFQGRHESFCLQLRYQLDQRDKRISELEVRGVIGQTVMKVGHGYCCVCVCVCVCVNRERLTQRQNCRARLHHLQTKLTKRLFAFPILDHLNI